MSILGNVKNRSGYGIGETPTPRQFAVSLARGIAVAATVAAVVGQSFGKADLAVAKEDAAWSMEKRAIATTFADHPNAIMTPLPHDGYVRGVMFQFKNADGEMENKYFQVRGPRALDEALAMTRDTSGGMDGVRLPATEHSGIRQPLEVTREAARQDGQAASSDAVAPVSSPPTRAGGRP